VLDDEGAVASDTPLVVNGVPYQEPGGVAVTDGGVLVTTTSPAAVLRVDTAAGTVTKVADIPDVPLCLPVVRSDGCQAAVPDTPPRPEHLASSGAGELYVADRGQACLFRIAPGETVAKPWLCDLSFAPLPAATDGGLAGLAVAGDRVLFTVSSGFDGSDSVQAVTVDGGAPADRQQLAAPPNGAGVAGLTVLADGRVVAALSKANALFVIAGDGASRVLDLNGISGPVDVEVSGDDLLIAHHSDGAAGRVSKRPSSSLP
jgi:hypothetical protein